MELPQEMIDEILSYGDPEVTQKFDCVLNQMKYHRKMLQIDSNISLIHLGRVNVYRGISQRDFYLYILDKSYMKKNVYNSKSKFFSKNIIFYNNLWATYPIT
jgi:hypothetical protein